MEKACKNCEYFVQMSMPPSQHPWGDCVKAGNATVPEDGTKKGVFTWAADTCPDFKPKQEVQEGRSQNGPNR